MQQLGLRETRPNYNSLIRIAHALAASKAGSEWNLLHFSALHNAFGNVQLLIELGVDGWAADSCGRSPLQLSVQYCKTESTIVLSKGGVSRGQSPRLNTSTA